MCSSKPDPRASKGEWGHGVPDHLDSENWPHAGWADAHQVRVGPRCSLRSPGQACRLQDLPLAPDVVVGTDERSGTGTVPGEGLLISVPSRPLDIKRQPGFDVQLLQRDRIPIPVWGSDGEASRRARGGAPDPPGPMSGALPREQQAGGGGRGGDCSRAADLGSPRTLLEGAGPPTQAALSFKAGRHADLPRMPARPSSHIASVGRTALAPWKICKAATAWVTGRRGGPGGAETLLLLASLATNMLSPRTRDVCPPRASPWQDAMREASQTSGPFYLHHLFGTDRAVTSDSAATRRQGHIPRGRATRIPTRR